MSEEKFWWEAEDNQIHESVFPYVQDLEEQQGGIHRANLEHAKLYSNRQLNAIRWDGMTQSLGYRPLRPVTENIIQSVCDTATSLIAKNKPRAAVQTDGANFTLQDKAKKLDQYLFGEFEYLDVYEHAQDAFRDCTVFGDGFAKVGIDDGEIFVERVMPDEVIVDERECVCSDPQQMHHRFLVDKETLKGMYPDFEEEIDAAQEQDWRWTTYRTPPVGQIVVVESWRLGVKHSVCIQNVTLVSESYDKDFFPFAKISWSKSLAGFYGQGLAEQLAGIQLRINKINKFIDRVQDLVSKPRFLVPHNSRITPEDITNDDATIIFYTGLQEPKVWIGQAVSPEIFKRLEDLKRSAFEIAGISQLSAQSKKPGGLDSGAALREFNDIETERFAIQAQAYERFVMDIAKLIIDSAKDLFKNKKVDRTAQWRGNNVAKQIKWSEVDMDEDRYVIHVQPASILSKTPAGRRSDVADLIGMQLLDKDMALYLMGVPDVMAFREMENADVDDARKTAELLMDGKFPPPETFQNLPLTVKYVNGQYLKLSKMTGVPEDILEAHREWMEQAKGVQDSLAPPPVPPGEVPEGGVPQ